MILTGFLRLNTRDRRVLAEPIGVSVEQVLPRFRVAADALKQVYKLYQDRVATSFAESDLLCYLCGNAATILSGKYVTLTKIVMKQVGKSVHLCVLLHSYCRHELTALNGVWKRL
jgi:hypothetical protein